MSAGGISAYFYPCSLWSYPCHGREDMQSRHWLKLLQWCLSVDILVA